MMNAQAPKSPFITNLREENVIFLLKSLLRNSKFKKKKKVLGFLMRIVRQFQCRA